MTRTLKFGGLTGSGWSRTTKATFGPGGKVVEQSYADQANGQTSVTKATYTYDDRGNPKALTWTPPGVAARPVATQTRNVAGLVTQRRAALAGFPGTTGSWKTFNTDFAYDAPTRVASQTVTNGGSTPLAKQQLDYYGADDPGRLRHWLGTVAYDFTFGYDRQHELTNVSEAGNKYSATFAYGALVGGTPSGSGKFRSATVGGTPQSGGQVVARNVTYDYAGSVDPEAPSGLVNVVGGARLRSYVYDAAGNQTEVHGGAIATPPRPTDTFVYDGDDQLRRATKFSPGTTTVTGSEEYFYDHAGQRVGVVTRNAAGAVTKLRAFVGDTEVELSAAGAVTQAYAYLALGTPVAKVVSPAGGWTSAGASVTWANSPSSLELQYHGLSSNTLLSVRPNGVVQAGFVYAPYGDVVQTSGATSGTIAGQRRRFNDKFKDDLTGLSYYGVRYYDGLALGWTQADPMYRFVPDAAWTEPRRAGLYQFVLGNPVRYYDPDGRDVMDVVRGAGCATIGFLSCEAAHEVKLVAEGRQSIWSARRHNEANQAKIVSLWLKFTAFRGLAPIVDAYGQAIDDRVHANGHRRVFTWAEKMILYVAAGGKCEYCGVELDILDSNQPNSLRGDHVVPWWLHPETLLENGAASCRTCNLVKAWKAIGAGPNEYLPPLLELLGSGESEYQRSRGITFGLPDAETADPGRDTPSAIEGSDKRW